MKTLKYTIAAAAAMFALAGCQPEYLEPSKDKLPSASSLTPVITIDQETNYVTFSVEETGLVPLWIFGEEKIDGKDNKKYSYAENGVTLRIREAGTHTVELKAYNAHGISLGSQMVEFTLENTYRDPFDPAPYLKKLANSWVWNAESAGHFGCGESGTEGVNWWAAGPHEKDGWALYDDIMTFTADGMYTYDPVDGQTYVNKDSGYKNEYNTNDGNDYIAPIDGFTHPFTVENNWNDAGIEEVYLVLQEGDNLSYIPNPEALKNPRYRILGLTSKQVDLVVDNGNIAWRYQFVPYVKQATPEEILAGTESTGKAWIMDSATPGHLGCGESLASPTNWWAAGPNEKADWGMYDDVLTFFPDGKYIFNPGEGGKIYVNKDVTLIGADENPHNDADFMVSWETQESTYTFDGEILAFPEGVVIGYVPNDATFTNAQYVVTELTETSLTIVAVTDGISWQYKFKARDIKAPEMTIAGKAVENGQVDLSLENGQAVKVTGIELGEIDSDYFEGDASGLTFIAPAGDYRIFVNNGYLKVVPLVDGEVASWGNGKALWIIGEGAGKPKGTQPGWVTGASADIPMVKTGADTYQVTLWCSENTNIKIFGQADWGTEWTTDKYASITGALETTADDGNLHSVAGMKEGWYVLTVKDTGDGILSLNTEAKKETVYEIEAETNLYRSASINPELWYSEGDWSGKLSPDFELGNNNDFTVVMPEGIGGGEWMGQTKLHTGVSTSSDKIYDFCCTIVCDEDVTVTIKLTGNPEGDGDPHAFFYDGSVKLEAGEPFTYRKAKISQPESNDDFTVIFDFGRCPAGSTVTVTDVCFQEHIEK